MNKYNLVSLKRGREVFFMRHHKKRQKITIEQLNAIDLLVQGLSDREVAEKVGVARETVTRWRNENPEFRVALYQRRKEIWGNACEKLRALVTDAVNVLEREIKEEGNLRAAIEVLKAVGLYGNIEPPGSIIDTLDFWR
jgi:transcriptional regulator with XRE-family HTH domain